MKQFKVNFTVDGRKSEQIVSATGFSEAKKIVEAQYANSKVIIINVQDKSTGFYG